MTLRSMSKLLASFSFFASTSLFAAPLVVDVSGIESIDVVGNGANTVLLFNVGANTSVTSIAYNVNLSAYSPSYLSEITVGISDSGRSVGVNLTPAFNQDFPGTGTYADLADLVALGQSFNVGADGILRLEFFETFNDFVGADGIWNFGTLTFGFNGEDISPVPEPGTGLLLAAGLGMMGYAGRRRRRGAAGQPCARFTLPR